MLSIDLSLKHTRCSLAGMMFNHLLYADDMLLLSTSAKGLQTLVNKCTEFANGHIILNTSKTCCMLFQSVKHKIGKISGIHVNRDWINFVDNHKYLGIIYVTAKDSDDVVRQTWSINDKVRHPVLLLLVSRP